MDWMRGSARRGGSLNRFVNKAITPPSGLRARRIICEA
jgi:hypothetical protein